MQIQMNPLNSSLEHNNKLKQVTDDVSSSDSANSIKKKSFSESIGITVPWSPNYYFSDRGIDNFHIYLWISKDLAWLIDYLLVN